MRLIDADALKAFIKQNGYLYANTLDTFPAVDAVPVVRCGRCEFWQNDGVHIYGMCKNPNIGNVKLDTDYCSYGVSGLTLTAN